jgi:acetyl esterase/lipase
VIDPAGPYAVEEADVPYGGPADSRLLARVYRPTGAAGPLPALIDVHGGAWTYFDRTVDACFDRAIAACGMVVVALDFRQGDTHPYPIAVADVVAGLRFVATHAERLGVRRAPIGIVGSSSGGHLALLAALRPNAPEFGTTPSIGAGDPPVELRVAYVLALWPIADPLARYRYLQARLADPRPGRDRFFHPERLKAGHDAFFRTEASMAAASVPRLVSAGEAEHLPPLWIAHPELDENVTLEMSEHLADTYRAAGGSAELVAFPGVGHAFANLPGAAADACITAMVGFISRQLGAGGA